MWQVGACRETVHTIKLSVWTTCRVGIFIYYIGIFCTNAVWNIVCWFEAIFYVINPCNLLYISPRSLTPWSVTRKICNQLFLFLPQVNGINVWFPTSCHKFTFNLWDLLLCFFLFNVLLPSNFSDLLLFLSL